MPTRPWWETISAEELITLRRRLLHLLRQDFPDHDMSDLEDILQAAFLGMFVHRKNVSAEHDGLFGYLRTAARHGMIDHWRHTRVRERSKRHREEPVADREPPDALVHAENIEKIKEYLYQLDDLSRFVIWRHVVDGVPVRTLARELGCDRHTVARVLQAAFVYVGRFVKHER